MAVNSMNFQQSATLLNALKEQMTGEQSITVQDESEFVVPCDGLEIGFAKEAVALLELAVVAEWEEEGEGLCIELALEFIKCRLVVIFDAFLEVRHAFVSHVLLVPHQGGEESGLAALGRDRDELGAFMRLGCEVPAGVHGHRFEIRAEDDVVVP